MADQQDPWLEALDNQGLQVTAARKAAEVKGWLHSGNYALNYAVSGRFHRGYPVGHVVGFKGASSTGKSYLVARAIAEAQRAGGQAVLDDTEGAFSPDWAERALGVNVDALGLHKSMTVEEHYKLGSTFLDVVEAMVADGEDFVPYVMALDSLALLTTEEELEDDFGDPGMHGARRAKIIKRLFREIGGRVSDLPVVYLIANHVHSAIGSFFENKTEPGGSGPKYQSSVKVDMRATKKIKDGKEVIGVRIRGVVDKNRITAPYKEVVMTIPSHRAISPYSGLIPALLNLEILETSGKTLVFEGEDTGVYTQKTNPLKQDRSAEELMEAYPDLLEKADEILSEREEAQSWEGESDGEGG